MDNEEKIVTSEPPIGAVQETNNSGLDGETFAESKTTANTYEAPASSATAGSYPSNATTSYYTSGTSTTVNEEKQESKALEICALVFGILGIVCCCCYGFFGLIGLILSIIALATGKKSGLSIAGLVCSIVGILMTILMFVIGLSEYGQRASEDFMNDFSFANPAIEVQIADYVDELL